MAILLLSATTSTHAVVHVSVLPSYLLLLSAVKLSCFRNSYFLSSPPARYLLSTFHIQLDAYYRQDSFDLGYASSESKTLRNCLGGQENVYPLHSISIAPISSYINFISRLVQVPSQPTSRLRVQASCSGY